MMQIDEVAIMKGKNNTGKQTIKWEDMRIGSVYESATTGEYFVYLGEGRARIPGNSVTLERVEQGYIITKIKNKSVPLVNRDAYALGCNGKLLRLDKSFGAMLVDSICVRKTKPYAVKKIYSYFNTGMDNLVNTPNAVKGINLPYGCEIRYAAKYTNAMVLSTGMRVHVEGTINLQSGKGYANTDAIILEENLNDTAIKDMSKTVKMRLLQVGGARDVVLSLPAYMITKRY